MQKLDCYFSKLEKVEKGEPTTAINFQCIFEENVN
jgi:hypothetical protein